MNINTYQGIEGLGSNKNHGHGRNQAWGAVLTIGQKNQAKGYPCDTDKFFIKVPQTSTKRVGGRTVLMRENDPEFGRFHASDKPELRSVIRLNVTHPAHLRNGWLSMTDAFHFSLQAQQLPKHPNHPSQAPVCFGDGKKASRWDGKQYKDIPCPNRLCQFRDGRPAPCKPSVRMSFRLRWEKDQPWSGLPTPFVKFETKSWWNLDRVFIPFWRGLHDQAIQLGFTNYSFYDLPCVMKLGKRAAGQGSLVPAISLATDFPPGRTFRDFLLEQAQTQAAIAALHPNTQAKEQ